MNALLCLCVVLPLVNANSCNAAHPEESSCEGMQPSRKVPARALLQAKALLSSECPQGQTVSESSQACIAKPWSDFVSCQEEKDACKFDDDGGRWLREHCSITCGKSTSKTCTEDETLSESTQTCVAKPWGDFVSCQDEQGACTHENSGGQWLRQHCSITCGTSTTCTEGQTLSESTQACVEKPWGDFVSCQDEVGACTHMNSGGNWLREHCKVSCSGHTLPVKPEEPEPAPAPAPPARNKCAVGTHCKGTLPGYVQPEHCQTECLTNVCTCKDPYTSYADTQVPATGAACSETGREGCMRTCSPADCTPALPWFSAGASGTQCKGVGMGILGEGCCTASECCSAYPSSKEAPVPIDFYVFKRSSAIVGDTMEPFVSNNIGGEDGCTGFCRLDQKACDARFYNQSIKGTAYQMKFAEMQVVDLNNAFAELLPSDAKRQIFTMGDYTEVRGVSAVGNIDELIQKAQTEKGGKEVLMALRSSKATNDVLYPKPGRISVWIAATSMGEGLLGATGFKLSANPSMPQGPGLILSAYTQRRTRILMHEVGHIVGFGHAYWEDMKPCEMNIMGGNKCSKDTRIAFTAGATNAQKYPKILANWLHDLSGKPSQEKPHPEVDNLLQTGANQLEEDVAVNCKELAETGGQEALDDLLHKGGFFCSEEA